MAIAVNWKRLKATHRELGGEGTLIVQLLPFVTTTSKVLDQALVDDPYPAGEGPANGGWFPGPKGWLLLLETDVDQALWDWIELLAERLTGVGIGGNLTGARHAGRVSWATDIQSQPFLNALYAYQPFPSEAMYGRGWSADPAILDAVLDHTMPWVLADADLAHVSMGSVTIGVPPSHATTLTRNEITASYSALTNGFARTKNRVRHLWFSSPTAIATAQYGHQPETWATMVADLREQLLTAPRDTLSLARVDIWPWHMYTEQSSHPLFSHDANAFGLYPDLWGEWSPDPCAIQILTTRHLAKAHDLSNWNLTPLDSDHWLVEATDPAPWFTTYGPFDRFNTKGYHYPDDLIRARHDFGDMILTPGKAHDLGLTTRPIPR